MRSLNDKEYGYFEDKFRLNAEKAVHDVEGMISETVKGFTKANANFIPEQSGVEVNPFANDVSSSEAMSDGRGVQTNQKSLVRTMGSLGSNGTAVVQKSNPEPYNDNSAMHIHGQGLPFSGNSNSGSASTKTLLFVFGFILVVMVFLVSYCIFMYMGS